MPVGILITGKDEALLWRQAAQNRFNTAKMLKRKKYVRFIFGFGLFQHANPGKLFAQITTNVAVENIKSGPVAQSTFLSRS